MWVEETLQRLLGLCLCVDAAVRSSHLAQFITCIWASIRHARGCDVTTSHNVQWGWCVIYPPHHRADSLLCSESCNHCGGSEVHPHVTHETRVMWTQICIAAQHPEESPVTVHTFRNCLLRVHMLRAVLALCNTVLFVSVNRIWLNALCVYTSYVDTSQKTYLPVVTWLGYRLDDGVIGVRFSWWSVDILYSISYVLAVCHSHIPTQSTSAARRRGMKLTKARNSWSCTSTFLYVVCGLCLIMHTNDVTSVLLIYLLHVHIFRVTTPYGVTDRCRYVRGMCCLYIQGRREPSSGSGWLCGIGEGMSQIGLGWAVGLSSADNETETMRAALPPWS
jgi:hypothetical protein